MAGLREGRATEYLIAATCILASRGELNALTALVDDEGVDLGLKRRDGTRTLDLQIKSRFWDEEGGSSYLRKKRQFMADVAEDTFRPRDDLWVLYVVMHAAKAKILLAWLVPSTVVAEEAFLIEPKKSRNQLRFQASVKPKTKDKWREYRLERKELVPKLVEVVRALDEPT